MKFDEFARRLKNIISGLDSGNGGAFAKELFQNILDIDDGKFDLDVDIAPSAYRAYFRGDRGLGQLAPKIRRYVEPEVFSTYIAGLGDDEQRDIFKEFAPDCLGMTDQNIPEKMAELFKKIIVDACPVKKKKPAKKAPDKEEPIEEEDFVLLEECGNKCPLCKSKLSETKKGVPIRKFDRIFILPLNLDTAERADFETLEEAPGNIHGLDNQTLLCKKCAELYQIDTEPSEYAHLMQLKKMLTYIARLDAEAYDINVERGIDKILDALSELKSIPEKEDKTTWEAFRVDKKIPDNILLQDTVTDFVLKYYRYIEKQYKQREREGKLRFKKVKNEISQCFELYDEAELSQNDIFYKLVDWLKEKTDCDDEVACTAMVAFFVQNCEVFHDEASK